MQYTVADSIQTSHSLWVGHMYRTDRVLVLYSGCGVKRRYPFPDGTTLVSTPLGNSAASSSFFTDGITMHFSPCYKEKK